MNDASHLEVRRHGGPSRNEVFGKKHSFDPGDVLEIVVQVLDKWIEVGQMNEHSRAAKALSAA